MPEYLAPGVYVEETSFRSRTIEGVSTTTTAFVGPTLKGPGASDTEPTLLTSFADFERIYGGLDDLAANQPNYVAHAARAFFDNGGSRLYVSRVIPGNATTAVSSDLIDHPDDPDPETDPQIIFTARFPGTGGDSTVEVIQNFTRVSTSRLDSVPIGSILQTQASGDPPPPPAYFLKTTETGGWQGTGDPPAALPGTATLNAQTLTIVTMTVIVNDSSGNEVIYEDLGFDSRHPRWIGNVLAENPTNAAERLANPVWLDIDNTPALLLRSTLIPAAGDESLSIDLTGGTPGNEPTEPDYEAALNALNSIEDISIIAAPGYSANSNSQAIQNRLIIYVERRRSYQIAVLDSPPNADLNGISDVRAQIDSEYAALYYPWVTVANPLFRPGRADIPREVNLPPSGFICGIYARNDIERGVYKAPANEVVRGALRFEQNINFAQQEALNPQGINCLRFFPGRGYRVWGARMATSNSEIKYVSDRRYLNYLERSIDEGTQFAVFEPNGPKLWTNIRDTISSFLYTEWFSGALLGNSPQEAFFVRCDRSTMTQNDLDNGRLICLVGVALQKPAEFVIFRIGQAVLSS